MAMDPQTALNVYRQIIEQSMGAGMFKKLSDLDTARGSLQALTQIVSLQNTNDGKSSNDKGSDESGS